MPCAIDPVLVEGRRASAAVEHEPRELTSISRERKQELAMVAIEVAKVVEERTRPHERSLLLRHMLPLFFSEP